VVDRIMIEQVLLNLIKNGIEAMSDVPSIVAS
jgi:C4-dicarboxylate-specific signal transduction histidine kinase